MKKLALYTRLRKDDYIKINKYVEKYPTLGNMLIQTLKNNTHIYNLTVSELLDINSVLLITPYHILNVYDINKKFNL